MIQFRFERFVFTTEVTEDLHLPPFKGGSLRGAMGELVRQAVCVRRRGVCSDCGESGCVYRALFEPRDEAGRPVAAPYVLEPPADERTVIPSGERFSFGLVLVGRALTYLPLLIMIFDEVGRKGLGRLRSQYRLRHVSTGGGREVYSEGRLMGLPPGKTLGELGPDSSTGAGEGLAVELLTPVHLRVDGRLADPARFSVLFEAVYRRVKLLARFHSDERFHEEPALREAAERVGLQHSGTRLCSVERLSRTQGKFLRYDGYVGSLAFAGVDPRLVTWLRAGEYVHVGHGCTFGLGRYAVRPAGASADRNVGPVVGLR